MSQARSTLADVAIFGFVRALAQTIKDALSTPVYSRRRLDKGRNNTLSSFSPAQVTSGLTSLSSTGRCKDIADVYDLMLATDPHIRGVVRQLKAGVQAVPWSMTPADESPEAHAIAMMAEKELNTPELNIAALIPAIVECELRGAGLIEILWNDVDSPRRLPIGFALVPQQRVTLDMTSGELGIILDPANPLSSVPMSSFPQGKFIQVIADQHVPDFALRGVYRTILAEWHNRVNVAGWEMQGLERYGLPIPIAYYSTEPDRVVAEDALDNFGAAGSLLVSSQCKIEFAQAATASNANIPHEAYLEKSAQRISVALVGSEQTATVGTDQGSKASAGVHAMVRGDVLASHWQTVSHAIRRYLIAPYVSMNWGSKNTRLAPNVVPNLESAPDRVAIATYLRALTELGLKIGEGYVRDETGIPVPGPDENILSAPSTPGGGMFGLASRQKAAAKKREDGDMPLSGAPIVDNINALLAGVSNEADLAALPLRIARSRPDTKVLVDQLAALQLDAWARGIDSVRKNRMQEAQ